MEGRVTESGPKVLLCYMNFAETFRVIGNTRSCVWESGRRGSLSNFFSFLEDNSKQSQNMLFP